ncbi:uncharacterized protein LOC132038092 [Lycium ferocissimum]|uniref:uncharacterized protein LOC132038092 n=1 Tax=Lycium ferocissimum TaxID=112874 RepID=UPI002814ACF8|nr:uncharacterized protein LOC132038092 [Lycium ferocissimum]
MDLNKAKAELVLHHKIIDSFWRQKANLKWHLEGDDNSHYFHTIVKGRRRRRLNIHSIKVDDQWMEGDENIAIAAVQFYEKLFGKDDRDIDMNMINLLPRLIREEDNDMHGFFKSERGVKQGDPISPSLFIIAAEVLSMLLNNLFDKPEFNGFSMQPNGPKINHISYADDIIIFCSGKTATLKLIMATLTQYELNSGQLINKEKSCFLVADDISTKRKNIILRNLNFQEKQFPITYLGCPLFFGRKKIQYFTEAATKIIQKVDSWQGKMLSIGGKIVLIKHVLSAMPIHLLSICQPPKNILQQIEKVFANFFWGTHEGKHKYHWASWEKMCLPTSEGGIGVRSMIDITDTFSAKMWWQFRTKKSLWTDYLKAKYCKRVRPLPWKIQLCPFSCLRRMMKIRHRVDHFILWQVNSGNTNFWWDNWSGLGSLAQFGIPSKSIKTMVSSYIDNNRWNTSKLSLVLPIEVVHHIQEVKINPSSAFDQPIWTVTASGRFDCNSAWNKLRTLHISSIINMMIWHKKCPFKVSFFLWRILKNKTSLMLILEDWVLIYRLFVHVASTMLGKMKITCSSRALIARMVWDYFCKMMGIPMVQGNMRWMLISWCMAKKHNNLEKMFPQIPPYMKWYHFFELIEKARNSFSIIQVKWNPPNNGWVKINSDGCSKGNPGLSGGGGVIRDHLGNLVMAYAMNLNIQTNNYAEAIAMKSGID